MADSLVCLGEKELLELSFRPVVEAAGVYGRDASNPYYDFLYRLVQAVDATRVLELGTCTGGSTSYLAAAKKSCDIVSVDIHQFPSVREKFDAQWPNVRLIQSDSRDKTLLTSLQEGSPFDLIFFDSDHNYELLRHEFDAFSPLLRPGGIALFDDIRMNEGMVRFWRELDWPKQQLNHLHRTGFGAAIREIPS